MISVERKALKEGRNYLNMAIRLKRNFRRFYYKRFLRSKIKKFNNFLLYRKKKLLAVGKGNHTRNFKKSQKSLKRRLHLSKSFRTLFVKNLYVTGYKRRYFFNYLRSTLDTIRIKKIVLKYRRYKRRQLWKKNYRVGFKRSYFLFFNRFSMLKSRHFRILSSFYKRLGFKLFLKKFLKYARLKAILKRYGRVFRNKKRKIIRKVSMDRIEKLILLNVLFQNLISSGKRILSLKIFANTFILLKFKYKGDFINNYLKSLERVRPLIHYKLMYIGGKKYRIPVLMPISKSYSIATRWLLNNSKSSGNTVIFLFNNINSSLKNEGPVVKYRKEHHAASFENKSYIRFLKFLKSGF